MSNFFLFRRIRPSANKRQELRKCAPPRLLLPHQQRDRTCNNVSSSTVPRGSLATSAPRRWMQGKSRGMTRGCRNSLACHSSAEIKDPQVASTLQAVALSTCLCNQWLPGSNHAHCVAASRVSRTQIGTAARQRPNVGDHCRLCALATCQNHVPWAVCGWLRESPLEAGQPCIQPVRIHLWLPTPIHSKTVHLSSSFI